MTENRKKYLNGTSREERFIREEIDLHNMEIGRVKFDFRYCKKEDRVISCLKEEIAKRKSILKILKKHLPAPTKSLIKWHCNCPKCGFFVDGEEDNYCYNCGQRLR